MPVQDIETAERLMRQFGHPLRMSGGIDDQTIAACESRLGCTLPRSYKEFLRRFGRMAFLSVEFYGFTRNGFDRKRCIF